jgi:hypothetical protein
VVAGGILIKMNKNGNPGSLVAAQPGNTNAAKFGVYSPRLIEPRAAEMVAELTQHFEFSVTESIALVEFARSVAILERIDLDLMERGVVDKRGEARSILNHRARTLRQLEHWLSKIAPAMERHAASESLSSPLGRSDYIRELQRIGLGHDSTAGARDRVAAVKTLLEIDSAPGPATVVQFHVPAEKMPRQVGDPESPYPAGDDGNASVSEEQSATSL